MQMLTVGKKNGEMHVKTGKSLKIWVTKTLKQALDKTVNPTVTTAKIKIIGIAIISIKKRS